MPAQRTPRRDALAGAGTTASLLAATVGGALVVAGLLGAGAFPGGPGEGSAAPQRIAVPLPRERTVSIVLPRAPAPPARRRAASVPAAARRPRRAAPAVPSRPTTSHRAPAPAPASHANAPGPKATPQSAPPPVRAPAPSAPAPGGPLAPAADTTREVAASAAGAAQPASPPLAATVGATGDTAVGAVENAGEFVATLTRPGR